jgi:arginine decarboxylase
MAKTQAPRIDHFFSAVAARLDLWRDVSRAAQAWAGTTASRGDAGKQAACNEALTAVLPLEDFQAYPGARVLNAIKERVAGGDAMGAARLVQRVSSALMSRSYRSDAGEFEAEDDAATPERAMPAAKGETAARPYFEVLFVTPSPASRWAAHAQQIRKLRRPEDEPGLKEFLRDRMLSHDATVEELAFLKNLRFTGRRPTALYYYRELQNLRDPLHFRPTTGLKAPAS